jgi:hypothetical protein
MRLADGSERVISQLLIGFAAAGVTYGVGKRIGAPVTV